MNELNDLMQNEFDAMVGMNMPMSDRHEEAMNIIRTKADRKESVKIEEMLIEAYNHAEAFGFKQGFMRGIAVTKGGAI